jgi:hypothetical protein
MKSKMPMSASIFGCTTVTGTDAEIFARQISNNAVTLEAIEAAKNGKKLALEFASAGVVAIKPLSYDAWLRAKVEKSIAEADDPNTPRYTTDEVMQRMDKIIKAAEERKNKINVDTRVDTPCKCRYNRINKIGE